VPGSNVRDGLAWLLVAVAGAVSPQASARADSGDAALAALTEGQCVRRVLHLDGFSIPTQACRFSTGLWRVEVDPELPGLALWRDSDRLTTVLQVFRKPANAPVEAILPQLIAQARVPDVDDCRFVAVPLRPAARSIAFHQIRPVGKRLEAIEARIRHEIPEPPCGDYGWSTHGVRYFMTDFRRPDRVLYIDEGQDGTLIDPSGLSLDPVGR
jgi:hypothetical protein